MSETVNCTCGSWDSGDLRALLFAAACPVHCVQVFGQPELEPTPVRHKVCGDCDHWMKSSKCPREKNINGWNHGPSMNGTICDQFQERP